MLHRPPPNDDELESVWRVLEEEAEGWGVRQFDDCPRVGKVFASQLRSVWRFSP